MAQSQGAVGVFKGLVLDVYTEQVNGEDVPYFSMYQEDSKETIKVKGNGVKKMMPFEGLLRVSMMHGTAINKKGKGNGWAFMLFEKVEGASRPAVPAK